jgi:formylglycine-generating enzyme
MRDSAIDIEINGKRSRVLGPDVEALMDAMDRELERALELDREATERREAAPGTTSRLHRPGEARWRLGIAVSLASTLAAGVAMAAISAATAPRPTASNRASGVIAWFLGSCSFEITAVPASRMVTVRGGSFEIDGIPRAVDDFELQNTEVTRAQFAELTGYDPSRDPTCGATCPVDRVSWDEAAVYCNALSAREGLAACYDCSGEGPAARCRRARSPWLCPGYRLPTALEWEYAARAGREQAAIEPALGREAWFGDPTGRAPTGLRPVARLHANPWELHDMLGNAWEWTDDENGVSLEWSTPESEEHAVRGGAWYSLASDASPSSRATVGPGFTRDLLYRPVGASPAPEGATLEAIGFRVARSASAAATSAR